MIVSEPTLKVTEIFKSIHGEGVLAGKTMAFVRVAVGRLNINPPTLPADNWRGEFLSIPEIVSRIKALGTSDVCLTGEQPLAQRNAVLLLETLLTNSFRVAIDIPSNVSVRSVPGDVIKLIEVDGPDAGGRAPAWENFDLVRAHDQIKFNVASQADFAWAQKLCLQRSLADKCLIFFSPVKNRSSALDLAQWMMAEEVEAAPPAPRPGMSADKEPAL